MRLLDGDLDRGFEPHILSGQCLLDEPWSRQRGYGRYAASGTKMSMSRLKRWSKWHMSAVPPPNVRESLGSRAIETGERLREQELPAIQIPPLEHDPTVWNHFTVVPAQAGIQGERRAVALDPRLRGGDDRVCSTCSDSALARCCARPSWP